MDRNTNLPYQIDTFYVSDVSKISKEDDIQFKLSHNHPLDPTFFGINDLSPSSYASYVEKLRDEDSSATRYINLSEIKINSDNRKNSCDITCRKRLYCRLNYAVNEQSVLCNGYDFTLE